MAADPVGEPPNAAVEESRTASESMNFWTNKDQSMHGGVFSGTETNAAQHALSEVVLAVT
ncbi:MAG: hypothetical protein FJ284_02260 [Planctomycetes bacterium]|nr:hypothetical protein [Planctomycetota bacterium]